jgi:uncharacterized membrane protein
MNRPVLTTLAAIAVLVASLSGVTGGAGTHESIAGTELQPDDVLIEVQLAADGSATWRVEYRVRLDDENVTAAFESLRTDVRRNESDFARPFTDRMRATVADAENATGREMAVENVSVSAERRQIPQEYGVVTYQFRWVGFAETDGSAVVAGDALSGFFLDNQTSLLVSWPDGYDLQTVSPEPTERRAQSVVWVGPTDFATGEPTLVVSTAAGGDGADTATTAPGDGSGSGGLPPTLLGLALVAAAVGAVGVVYYRSRGRPAGATDGHSEAGAHGRDDAGETPAEDRESEPAAAPSEPPEELLSNEERVLRLVRQRGGRMKQQEVAAALDWTDAKTSQVVRQMREEGQLEAFRLGRENVLSLPDEGDDGGA